MEDEASQHVVTFAVDVVVLLLDVELAEEVEGNDGVDVHDDGEQHEGQHQLLSVVRYWLQDGSQRAQQDGDIQQVGAEEEVVEVAQNGEGKVPQRVEERVVCYRHSRLPHLKFKFINN